MSAASLPPSPIAGDAARAAQDGAQDILGGIGLLPGGDRVGVRPVEIAEADAVISYLGVPAGFTAPPWQRPSRRRAVRKSVRQTSWQFQSLRSPAAHGSLLPSFHLSKHLTAHTSLPYAHAVPGLSSTKPTRHAGHLDAARELIDGTTEQ